MWQFQNPVKICFANGVIEEINSILQGRCYAIVTYNNSYFKALAERIQQQAEGCVAVFNQVYENPDLANMPEICQAFAPYEHRVEVLVALGGGSVIDTTKALAVARSQAEVVTTIVQSKLEVVSALPIIAIPTTTGTGSEVTSWATLWDRAHQCKYSLSDPKLYPEVALCDPKLTLELPISLTIQTGLDALSHAMESIWNKHRNPISLQFAKTAIQSILQTLPALVLDPQNLGLRENMMLASLTAGMAFSNTKTSLAHNISYGITLDHGTAHGIACSFTLPVILRSFAESDCEISQDLQTIFGDDLSQAAAQLTDWLGDLGIKTNPQDYGYQAETWNELLTSALLGERGQNFLGDQQRLQQLFQDQFQ